MAEVTIGRVLNEVVRFEEQLQDTYTRIRDQCVDHGARLLSYYLSRHRRQVERTCRSVDGPTLSRIKSMTLSLDLPASPDGIEALLNTDPEEVTGAFLLAKALAYHTFLRELCQQVLRQRLRPSATTFFEELEDLQEREVATLEKMLSIDYF